MSVTTSTENQLSMCTETRIWTHHNDPVSYSYKIVNIYEGSSKGFSDMIKYKDDFMTYLLGE